MKSTVPFSVLLSVYKKENPLYLQDALNSIYEEQTLKPTEIVLVKDGPLTPELETIISKKVAKYPNIYKIIPFEKNMGLGYALHQGIKACSNELIARMDTDDIAIPNRFEKQINYMLTNENIDVLGGALEEFTNIPGDLKSFRNLPQNHEEIVKFSKFRSPINHPTVVFKKSKVLFSGNYSTELLLWEDYVLWVKMLNDGAIFHNLKDVVLNFRVQDNYGMIQKRIGKNYAINEMKFAKFAKKIGYFSFFEYLKYITIKPIGRLMPKKIVAYIYKSFFRNNKES